MRSRSLRTSQVACGAAALLSLALCRCGLSANGQGSLLESDGGPSVSSSGGAYGGSSSGTTNPVPGSSSGGTNDDADTPAPPDADASDGATPPPLSSDAALSDARPHDAGSLDAAADAGSECSRLAACCPLLATYGSSATSVQDCYDTAATGNEGACSTVLGPLESVYLCL